MFTNSVLEIRNLSISFDLGDKSVIATQNINLELRKGEILGIVGESGSGKTVLCKSILNLLPSPPAKYITGSIWFNGKNLFKQGAEVLRSIRKMDISMIFQNPMSSFNPVLRIGPQIVENLSLNDLSGSQKRNYGIELLEKVGISQPHLRFGEYPHEWSGGMLQRAAIAMAIRNNPEILLADEPTTALDVSIQDQILALLLQIQEKNKMSMILISHDLGVVAETCDRVVVMYSGKVVEIAETSELFSNPRHPYTIGLMESIPRINSQKHFLKSIPGSLNVATHFNYGCLFSDRCQYVSEECKSKIVEPIEIGKNHHTFCIKPNKIKSVVSNSHQ